MKNLQIAIVFLLTIAISSCGAQKKEFDPEYVKVTNERAGKIVSSMDLNNPQKEQKVQNLIAEQYRNLSWIQDNRDKEIDQLKKSKIEESLKNKKIEKLKSRADMKIADLHKKYVKSLGAELTEEEVVEVKDGMTYGVVPKTYKAFQEMLPNLTQDQKDVIYKNLVEAREHAMDAGSSDMKHWWFGKYKGKINNYLSSEGYDLEKAGDEWQERIKAEKENQN